MKGSIRIIVGLLLVFGAVGGIDTAATNTALGLCILIASAGLFIMNSGVSALKGAR
jgi:hypothetical protein